MRRVFLLTMQSSLGLDVNKFKSDISSSTVTNKIQSDTNDGNLININETPTFYLDGVKIDNLPAGYSDFKTIVSTAISKK